MNYFLSGGAKNGKSSLAQEIVCAQSGPRYYLATMIPHDDEDRLRIRRHLENRAGLGFQTVECGTDILASLSQMDPDGAVLLDSVTALLSNEMFRADGTMDVLAPARLEAELLEFCRHHNRLPDYAPFFQQWSDEQMCNYAITLCHFIDKMMM